MRIVVPSAGRAETHTTARLLAGADYTYLVHDEHDLGEYLRHSEATGLDPGRIAATWTPRGNPDVQRRWWLENRAGKGEWVLFLDDDVRAFSALPEEWWRRAELPTRDNYGLWQRRYDAPCSAGRWVALSSRLAAECDRVGARLGGFSATRNCFFREKQWRYVGYVEATYALFKNDDPADWPTGFHMEDFAATAHHLLRYGVVVLNYFAHPINTHYIPGGMGVAAERAEARREAIARLMARYPGLFRAKEKQGGIMDLQLRLTQPAQVEKWREGVIDAGRAAITTL